MAIKCLRVGEWGFFGLLIFASALAHFLFIFFVPTDYLLKTELFGDTYEPAASVPLVFEFVGASDVVDELVKREEFQKEEQEEQEKQEEVKEEVKRQQFVDTADSAVDEEVEAETDMIGEKGTLARDTIPDEGPLTEEPRLEGDSEVPALGGLPGEGPGYGEELTEVLAEVVDDVENIEGTEAAEVMEELAGRDEAETMVEGEELAETEPEEAPPEGSPSDEDAVADDVAGEGEQVAVTQTEEVQGAEAPEGGSELEKEFGVVEERLDRDAEGLPTLQRRPRELAYVPPIEAQQRQAARKRQKKSLPKRARKPKVAISFNAKTLSGGTIEPVYEGEDANAPREGQEAFTVMKDEYAPYYRHIRDRITWYWVLKYGTKAEIKLETKKNTPIIIEFKVYPNGEIKSVHVVEEAGNHLLASYIKETISETRLKKFPSYVEEEFIDVRFNFYFF